MVHYLDSSVIVALLLPDVHSMKADDWLTRSRSNLAVSDFCKIEFAAVVSRRARMKGLTALDAALALGKFDLWIKNTAQLLLCAKEDMIFAETLVRDFSTKLSAPDAIHLAIAGANGLVLTTFDERLAAAARMQKIETVIPS